MSIPESDWKLLRRLHPIALDRFCASALRECAEVASAGEETNHERFLTLCRLVAERNHNLADAFDDMRRSRAWERIAGMRVLGVITDEEFQEFSEQTQTTVQHVIEIAHQ